MYTRSARQALEDFKSNRLNGWNTSGTTKVRSPVPSDAANRIYDRFAEIGWSYAGPKLTREDPIFTMGSCFAREIEKNLRRRGARIVSVDSRIERPEFMSDDGRLLDGFLNRFTPASMLQELQWRFGELPTARDDSLIFPLGGGRELDLNYWTMGGADLRAKSVRARRKVAHELGCAAADAKLVILTLGLIEAWLHKPTGLFANYMSPQFVMRHKDQFEFRLLTYQDTLAALESIRGLLLRHHRTGTFRILVTVSPVPLTATFTSEDVVVANMTSKATLRAAATDFAGRHDDVDYFPSYEMALYTNYKHAWQPDRLHVKGTLADAIVETFVSGAYAPPGLPGPEESPPTV